MAKKNNVANASKKKLTKAELKVLIGTWIVYGIIIGSMVAFLLATMGYYIWKNFIR